MTASIIDAMPGRAASQLAYLLTDHQAPGGGRARPAALTVRAVEIHDRLAVAAVERWGGRLLALDGEDGCFAAFATAADATAAAGQLQHALDNAPWPAGGRLRARIAIDVGDAAEDPAAGPAGRCACLRRRGHPGQILLTAAAAELAGGAIAPGAHLQDMGGGVRQLVLPGLQVVFPPLRAARPRWLCRRAGGRGQPSVPGPAFGRGARVSAGPTAVSGSPPSIGLSPLAPAALPAGGTADLEWSAWADGPRRRARWLAVGTLAALGTFVTLGWIIVSRSTPAPAGPRPGVPLRSLDLPGAQPWALAAAPDGALWFTESGTGRVGHLAASGQLHEYPLAPAVPGGPPERPMDGLAVAPDSSVWVSLRDRIGHLTPTGDHTTVSLPHAAYGGLALGPDGNLWVAEAGVAAIARISPATGQVTEFPLPGVPSGRAPVLGGMTNGPDGNLWFSEPAADRVGRITPAGSVTVFQLPGSDRQPGSIVTGPDGSLWFAENEALGRVTPTGEVSEVPLLQLNRPHGLTAGPDGALWFTDQQELGDLGARVGRFDPRAGTFPELFPLAANVGPEGVAAGPGGEVWVAERSASRLVALPARGGRADPAVSPGARRAFAAAYAGFRRRARPLDADLTDDATLRAGLAGDAGAAAVFSDQVRGLALPASLSGDVNALLAASAELESRASRAGRPGSRLRATDTPDSLLGAASAADEVQVRLNVVRTDLGLPRSAG